MVRRKLRGDHWKRIDMNGKEECEVDGERG